MIVLPRHLAPWEEQLALFPENIALAIGPMVTRLAGLISRWQLDRAHLGTPNGYDGIARRGPYERLLASEWLLLDEMPDEFMRRVVAAEHLFLQPTYHADAAEQQTVTLFDSGGEQLGAPRIAHLAMLIVLAQRAMRAKARFRWGFLQDDACTLHEGVTKPLVRHLIEARCARAVVPEDADRWVASFGTTRPAELWFVGAERVGREAQRHGASALMVADVLAPGEPQRISITATAPKGETAKPAILDCPESRAAVQLLRDPFAIASPVRHATAAPVVIAPGSNIVFALDGRKLYMRGGPGKLIAVHIPNSPRASVPPPATFALPEDKHTIIGVGAAVSPKRTIVLSQSGDEVYTHILSKRLNSANRTHRATANAYRLPDAGHDAPLRPLGVLCPWRLVFIDANGSLIKLAEDQFALVNDGPADAMRATHNGLVYINSRTRRVMRTIVAPSHGPKAAEIRVGRVAVDLPIMPNDTRYYFGTLGLANLVAYSPSQSLCTVIHNMQPREIEIPRTHSVAGMIDAHTPISLVLLDGSRTRIELLREGKLHPIVTTRSPIVQIAVSDVTPIITYLTEAGELGIYSCRANAMVLQLATDGGHA